MRGVPVAGALSARGVASSLGALVLGGAAAGEEELHRLGVEPAVEFVADLAFEAEEFEAEVLVKGDAGLVTGFDLGDEGVDAN